MSKQNYSISIKRVGENSFSMKKDENMMHMMGIGYGFYRKLLEVASQSDSQTYGSAKQFTDLIDKLSSTESEVVVLDAAETTMLREWINCMCQILIETNGISVDDENIKKFFRVSESFVKKTNPEVRKTNTNKKKAKK